MAVPPKVTKWGMVGAYGQNLIGTAILLNPIYEERGNQELCMPGARSSIHNISMTRMRVLVLGVVPSIQISVRCFKPTLMRLG